MAPSTIAELSITLRLPLQVFQMLANHVLIPPDNQERTREEDNQEPTSEEVMAPTREDVMAVQWSRVWYALTTPLVKLRRISLWLDHDGTASWCFANERPVLSFLTDWIAPERGTALESVTLNLPNLHPLHESPILHFTLDSPRPRATTSFTINRRVRQRYFYEDATTRDDSIVFAPDFPLLLEIREVKNQDFEHIPLEDIEEQERELWASGQDVEHAMWHVVSTDLKRGLFAMPAR